MTRNSDRELLSVTALRPPGEGHRGSLRTLSSGGHAALETEQTPRAAPSVVRYVDPLEGFHGYLAFAAANHHLAAGGFRVQQGLEESTIVRLAGTMALKERLLGLAVDGAKAGIDYDPCSSGKRDAMYRFIDFLRPYLSQRLSLGPDMGTSWSELEVLGRHLGLMSLKTAVWHAQGLDQADFVARLRLLDSEIDGATLGERRAGHALAHAALGAAAVAGLPHRGLRVGVHGFGTLGRGSAMALSEAGVTPTAVTDEHTCLHCRGGSSDLASLPDGAATADVELPHRFFELPLDVLVVASCENAVSAEQAERLQASVVAVGSNLGLSAHVETVLHQRGILVVPDFVGGCGGSASMDALFGPATCPTAKEVLEVLSFRMRSLVEQMVDLARQLGVAPREAAMAMSRNDVPPGRPYGRWQASIHPTPVAR